MFLDTVWIQALDLGRSSRFPPDSIPSQNCHWLLTERYSPLTLSCPDIHKVGDFFFLYLLRTVCPSNLYVIPCWFSDNFAWRPRTYIAYFFANALVTSCWSAIFTGDFHLCLTDRDFKKIQYRNVIVCVVLTTNNTAAGLEELSARPSYTIGILDTLYPTMDFFLYTRFIVFLNKHSCREE